LPAARCSASQHWARLFSSAEPHGALRD